MCIAPAQEEVLPLLCKVTLVLLKQSYSARLLALVSGHPASHTARRGWQAACCSAVVPAKSQHTHLAQRLCCVAVGQRTLRPAHEEQSRLLAEAPLCSGGCRT